MAAQAIYDFGSTEEPVAINPSTVARAQAQGRLAELDRPAMPAPPVKFPPASVHPVAPAYHDSARTAGYRPDPTYPPAARLNSGAEAFVPPPSPTSIRRPFALQPDRTAELRRCEDLFFSFTFGELVNRTTHLIDQKCQSSDPYAFRCFAMLGQVQQGARGEEEVDLVDLLRDYFRACELSVLTEGATVCRLFLKLVFGDLVKRISRAQSGARFTLEKTDPLCGGAFAILEGDFKKARQRFDAAIADPFAREYALAGIGLLKIFDTDFPAALAAFTRAGSSDDDILKLARLLHQH
jgi:hypothetical protein